MIADTSPDAVLLALTLAQGHGSGSVLVPRVADTTLGSCGSWAPVVEAEAELIQGILVGMREQLDDDGLPEWHAIADELSAVLARIVARASDLTSCLTSDLYESLSDSVADDRPGLPEGQPW